jgi:hypothetical protein
MCLAGGWGNGWEGKVARQSSGSLKAIALGGLGEHDCVPSITGVCVQVCNYEQV